MASPSTALGTGPGVFRSARPAFQPHPAACCAAALLVSIVPAAGRAECLAGGISGGVAARVDASVLPVLAPVLRKAIPTRFDVPDTPYTVYECSGFFDDTVVTPHGMVAQVEVRSLELRFETGAVVLDAVADVQVGGVVDLQLCAMPDESGCQLRFSATGVRMHAKLEPSVASCRARMPVTDFAVVPDPAGTVIALDSCGLYDSVWDTVYEWFQDYILQKIATVLGDTVKEKLPPLLEEFTTGLLAEGGDFGKLHVAAMPESIEIAAERAVIVFAGDLRPLAASPCVPTGAALPTEKGGTAPVPSSTAMVSLSVSQSLVQRAVRASWLAGLLCYDSSEFGLDLSTPLDFLAPGVQVDGRIAVVATPSVSLGSGAGGRGVIVRSDSLRADVDLRVPGYETSTLSATLGATLSGTVAIDPALQSLVLDLDDARSEGAVLTAPGTSLAFSAATLDGVVRGSLLPALARYRGRMALLGNLFVTAPVAVRVAGVDVHSASVQADLELFPKDSSDRVPPVAALAARPRSPSQPRFAVELASTDDRTPARFLRHRVRVDRTTDPEIRSGTRVVVSGLADGPHRVELPAMDVDGNESARPATFDVIVDSVEPVVALSGTPQGVLRGNSARIGVSASDDTSPSETLKLSWTLGIAVGGNLPDEPLSSGTLLPGDDLALGMLPEGRRLRVTVTATDEAGNEGSAEAVFFCNPNPTLGCSAAGEPGAAVVPALAALAFRRRRGKAA